MSIIEFRADRPRLRRRPARESTGTIYYGAALRRMLAGEPEAATFERAWLVVCVVVPIAVGIAAVIATW